jgi:hypothetical protein
MVAPQVNRSPLDKGQPSEYTLEYSEDTMNKSRLTAIGFAYTKKGYVYVKYRCICGTEKILLKQAVDRGTTLSCGCLKLEYNALGRNLRHGQSRTVEYDTWCKLIARCTNPDSKDWPRYGGRGITVCDGWRHSYEQFILDMGKRPEDKSSIDRIDNEKGYSKDNCRWATTKEQAWNK